MGLDAHTAATNSDNTSTVDSAINATFTISALMIL